MSIRRSRVRWGETGSGDAAERAARMVEQRLARKSEPSLDEGTCRRLRAIEARGLRELGD